MTVSEIFDQINVSDINRAIDSFQKNPYLRKGVKDEYILQYNGKEYPGRELIMRAANNQFNVASNPKSFTTVIAKKKLIQLGFKTFKTGNKMFKYYLKKVSKQDDERTTVINSEAAKSFFSLSFHQRNDSATITLKYLPDNTIDRNIKIFKKQDIRIFIDRERFKKGDILLFENTKNGEYSLRVIKNYESDYSVFSEFLKSNYLLTNQLPINHTTADFVTDSEFVQKYQSMKFPLNQILFGPPGTGKTDSTVEKALEILEMSSTDADEQIKREENREIFRSLLNKKIFFVTMHPSYSYEDFVQGIKPQTSEKKELLFEPKPGIFKVVSGLAKKIFEDEGEIIDNEIDNKDILRLCFFLSKFNSKADKKANKYFGSESNGEVFAIVGNRFGVNPNSIKNHRDKFDFLTTDDRKGWHPHNSSNDKLDNTPLWPYHDIYLELNNNSFEEVKDVVKSIEKRKETKVKRTVDNKNFVLILDEINRANISKVFGELITLLEEDKRIGNENEISVTLPSGESFSVPPNLYIIGTMNTADKSIALVDIALRRRFQFIPIYPQPDIIEKYGKKEKGQKKILMENLNKQLINQTGKYYKGVDFQIGHAYFLKDNSLAEVINENVIPLLTEYFRNDLEKVKNLMTDIGNPLDEDYYNNTGLLKYKE
jgi:5-methylcytosine-specific restriction protein B